MAAPARTPPARRARPARAPGAGGEEVARVVHDMRGPLTIIRGLCERLAHDEPRPERRRGLRLIEGEAIRLSRALDGLLRAPRPVSAHRRLSLAALVAEAAERHRAVAAGRGVALAVRLPGGPVVVQGDAEALRRALDNLLLNALRHTPAGGRVRARLSRRGPWAHVRVDDDGPGVPPEDRQRIFLAGERGAGASGPGRGLGLAIARDVARAHAGRLVLVPADQGACFRLSIPLAEGVPAGGGRAA